MRRMPMTIRSGFTLIEMLVVIIIIALIAALIYPAMGFVQAATSTRAASHAVAVAVETARQIVNERSDTSLDVSIYVPGATGELRWSGAAALFTASGQIRLV